MCLFKSSSKGFILSLLYLSISTWPCTQFHLWSPRGLFIVEYPSYVKLVRVRRLELPRLSAPDSKSGVATITPHPHNNGGPTGNRTPT